MANSQRTETNDTTKSHLTFSDARLHYESLTTYFKWLVGVTLGALGLVVTVGVAFFYRDMQQARQAANTAITDAKSSVERELERIRQDAANVALREAQRRVDDAFRTTNVKSLVESAARREVAPIIEAGVRRETDRALAQFQDELSAVGEVVDMGTQMRIGFRSGLEGLASIAGKGRTESSRRIARALMESVSKDYEATRRRDINRRYFSNFLEAAEAYGEEPIDRTNPIPGLVRMIRTSSDLNQVSAAFLALEDATRIDFKMFDIPAVELWCAGHRQACPE